MRFIAARKSDAAAAASLAAQRSTNLSPSSAIDCILGAPQRRPDGRPYRVFSKISRPISMRRISLVPAPIS
jgi:hypothetical protein